MKEKEEIRVVNGETRPHLVSHRTFHRATTRNARAASITVSLIAIKHAFKY